MNISPTHCKILTATAPTLGEAGAVLEASFLEWSKDHPEVAIVNIQQNMAVEDRSDSPDGELGNRHVEAIKCTMALTVIYALPNTAEGIRALTFSTELVVNAWRNYLAQQRRANEQGGDLSELDMRVAMSSALAQLNLEFTRVREW